MREKENGKSSKFSMVGPSLQKRHSITFEGAGCQIDYTSHKSIQNRKSQNFYATVKNANKNKNQD
ncbi:hypothetical protein [Archaeoglobus sulfaticallidus]|uniref:hypothetical protein n=1 Tax=Archaeoglobus sulfaticallidus TaxID=1316941 RepID=UPI00064F4AA8|nr:hypothetical protein [Archaeoglobus sulfaticallidus]